MSPSALHREVNGEPADGSMEVVQQEVSNGHNGTTNNSRSDDPSVVVVGAGPAGLMLASNLVRYGIKTKIVDNRPNKTSTGRADGLQPKTIETLRQMRLADPVLRKGVRIYDICFWSSSKNEQLHRTGREVHYPPVVDVLEPYILLVHQGMVEELFLDDLAERGVQVERDTTFLDYAGSEGGGPVLELTCKLGLSEKLKKIRSDYIVGCDGAHSQVRKCIDGATPIGTSSDAVWGVLDGVIDTDFPDLWSKVVVYSEEHGSILMIPRERNMTRLYIELKSEAGDGAQKHYDQEYVMARARDIMKPYKIEWTTVEWFGRYQIGQRVAGRFICGDTRLFIAGDASHTHSPKAAQGMNTSMHDSWNLAWKFNLSIRGLAKPNLLGTYEQERRKIAEDLIDFDYEHANAFHDGDAAALAENFKTNIRFISGIGAEYAANILNESTKSAPKGDAKPGCLMPPSKVTRYIDANPVDLQLDIPMLGQFRVFLFTPKIHAAKPFLDAVCNTITSQTSFLGRLSAAARASYTTQPVPKAESDAYVQTQRYIPHCPLFTYGLITTMSKTDVEIADLPPLLQDSRWTFYLDDVPKLDTRGQTCTQKWLGGLADGEVAIVNVRPDGYVGSLGRWPVGSVEAGEAAGMWLEGYYGGFLEA
ncbi:phenol 2-monooxygenase [Patellaria atrata CBS 101060]|uniref:Phenol 2-monooxygenase n=1 Tax=Patellaria atrata CBS 101060 TaxID=1346257 RepID=A0A9P4S4Q8_9PEZI|nr:phenol 2-monooxygenase [Patellaria atrata CBS 101060]